MIERSGLWIVIPEIALMPVIYSVNTIFIPFLIIALAFSLFFFRDPTRDIEDGITSPADGRVDYISKRRIEIFMSPFDCHVNLAPVRGSVTKTNYIRGSFWPAFIRRPNSERNEIYISNEYGEFKVTQVAGMFARRIVCYIKEGDTIEKGQKIGFIKFGSRAILEVPPGFEFTKSVGDKVKAGEMIAVKKDV